MTTKAVKKPAKRVVVGIYLCLLCLLLGLGAWQLVRGLEKAAVEKELEHQAGQLYTFNSKPESWSEYRYSPVELTGKFLVAQSFLLDNRIFKGQLGYEVLSPFQLQHDGSTLLVNRGWISKNRIPDPMFQFGDPGENVTISGQLYFPGRGFTLGPSYTDAGSWPVIVQYIDHDAISGLLDMKLETPIIVLDGDPDHGLVKLWRPYIIDATRHYGYAAQWWGLSIVFIVFGLIWRRMSTGDHE
jgi:cytochrome oxidase assembly protein ShyY1